MSRSIDKRLSSLEPSCMTSHFASPSPRVARTKPCVEGPSRAGSVGEDSHSGPTREGSQSKTKRTVSTKVDLHVPRAPITQVKPGENTIGASRRKPAEVDREWILIVIIGAQDRCLQLMTMEQASTRRAMIQHVVQLFNLNTIYRSYRVPLGGMGKMHSSAADSDY